MIDPYALAEIEGKTNFVDRALVLEMCTRLALRVPGNFIEFGVYQGDSTKVIARTLRKHSRGAGPRERRFFALDSFEGLRESYENCEVGTFACEMPRIRGVEIVKGYFEDTLTGTFAEKLGRVAFAHLDADLFSSTLCALRFLTPLLDSGSVLAFDEFMGSDGAERRAFEQWRDETGIQTLLIADFAREPSGLNTERTDVRPLFQVVKTNTLPTPKPRSELAKAAAYYRRRVMYHLAVSRARFYRLTQLHQLRR